MNRSTRLWIGVGACLVIAAPGSPLLDAAAADEAASPASAGHGPHPVVERIGQGGEGGEGGEGGATVRTPADYVTRLLLMKGHLRVGRELYLQGARDHAAGHFSHPRAELYDSVAPALAERQATPFAEALQALVDASLANAGRARVLSLHDAAIDRIDAAIARVDEAQRQSPSFVAEVVVRLLRHAADEYREAVEGDRFVNVAEYQDSRGFVLTAIDLLEANAAAFAGENRTDYERLRQQIASLAGAWPGVTPPARPVMDAAQVQAAVSQIELAASPLRAPSPPSSTS